MKIHVFFLEVLVPKKKQQKKLSEKVDTVQFISFANPDEAWVGALGTVTLENQLWIFHGGK